MSYMDAAYAEADYVIKKLNEISGLDYNVEREEIARVFDEDIWNGNWESTTDFDPAHGLNDLLVIQEDEYDQSMSDDEKPDWDDMLFSGSGYYVWYLN